MDHALPQMERLKEFGDMLEDDVEKCHQDMIRFVARYGKMHNENIKAYPNAQSERIANEPKVEEKKDEAMESTSRKRKEGQSKAQVNQKKKKKEARHAKRKQDLSEEKDREPGARIEAYEMTKSEHK